MTEGIRQGYRFQEHLLFLYFSGQVLKESLVKGRQTRYDKQEYSPSSVALLSLHLYLLTIAAPAPSARSLTSVYAYILRPRSKLELTFECSLQLYQISHDVLELCDVTRLKLAANGCQNVNQRNKILNLRNFNDTEKLNNMSTFDKLRV